jgi:hypothetical protein
MRIVPNIRHQASSDTSDQYNSRVAVAVLQTFKMGVTRGRTEELGEDVLDEIIECLAGLCNLEA